MSFPLSLIAFAYLILVGIFCLFSFFNLYHLLRFGSPAIVTLTVSAVYLAGTAVLLVTSWFFLQTVDWSTAIELLPTPNQFSW